MIVKKTSTITPAYGMQFLVLHQNRMGISKSINGAMTIPF
jgi:hypothetical protein